ncbi:MFS general substrate transporter [Glonium stellatum]|uniref:MFS general substrate transporter n=1 Tax=Glonium stellatum TaxID=574774 RepID=A0A8E2F694_9PEZI|nr:MFS general substrate transporter [Glonium stellatum]
MAASQILAEYLLTGFGPVFGIIATDLKSTATRMAWASCIHSVITASTTLPFARLADMHGGYPVFIFGTSWLCIWTIISGFANNSTLFTVSRAMHGLAISAFQPASLSMIGTVYPAGKRRNLVLSIFGASAPLGFFSGIASGTLTANFDKWNWYFWAASILSLLVTITTAITSPRVCRGGSSTKVTMDWWGSFTIVSGLLLITYSLASGSNYENGYYSYQTLVPLFVGLASLCAAMYIEFKIAVCPLLPRKFFDVPSMKPFLAAILFLFGCFGIFIFYATFYLQAVENVSPIKLLTYFIPLGVGGIVAAALGGSIMHIIPLTNILIFSGVTWIMAPLLFALAPPFSFYWKYIGPSMICITLGVDLTFIVSTVFLTSTQPPEYQGIAGAVCSVFVNVAAAFSLGIAHIIYSETQKRGISISASYKCVFWFATASSCVGFLICLLLVRIPKVSGDLIPVERPSENRKRERERDIVSSE